MKALSRAVDGSNVPVAPGTVFHYSTGDAFLSGLVVQRATGMTLEQYLEQKIWQPFGMESDGNWWSVNGMSFGGSGFSATLRDYVRFGLFVSQNGVLSDGTKVLPDNWINDAITWSSASASAGYADNGQYGYMWWFNPAYDNGLYPDPITLDSERSPDEASRNPGHPSGCRGCCTIRWCAKCPTGDGFPTCVRRNK